MKTHLPHQIHRSLPLFVLALCAPFLIAAGPADTRSAGGPAETVWVCKYVEVPGTELLAPAPGRNPLRVDVNSVGDGTFNDAHHSLVLWEWDSEGAPDCVALNPLPQPDSDPDPVVTPDPDPVVTPDPDPEPVITPDPDPIITPDPDPEPVVTPDPAVTPDPDPESVVTPDPDPQPVVTPDPVITPDPDPQPVVTPDPVLVLEDQEGEDEAVVTDPGNEEYEETACVGSLRIRIADVLGEQVAGASVALNGEPQVVSSGAYDIDEVPCGAVAVELETVPEGYVFVRTELDQTETYLAQSAHTGSRKVSATVDQDATSTVLFVVDPLEVLSGGTQDPAPQRDPLGAPNPPPAQDDPQPAPQPAPEEPVAAPTLPRTGIPAGRLLAMAILMLTAGGAMLGSRSVDR